MALSTAAFDSVVRAGALVPNGMPAFPELTDPDLAAVRQYVRSRAADLRAGEGTPGAAR
jgi:quinohemoprotein ethanol dehydrogenase